MNVVVRLEDKVTLEDTPKRTKSKMVPLLFIFSYVLSYLFTYLKEI